MKRLVTALEAAGRSLLIYVALSSGLLALGMLRSSREMVHAFDTGIYLQILAALKEAWASSGWHGLLVWPSSVTGEANFLAHHFQPIVALLLPIYSIVPSTEVLFFVSWLSLGLTAVILGMRTDALRGSVAHGQIHGGFWAGAVGPVFICLFPAFAARLYFGFAPDILAVPAFAMQAIIINSLSEQGSGAILTPPRHDRIWAGGGVHLGFGAILIFFLAQIWAGACKEVFWIINAWSAFILAARLNWLVQRRKGLIMGIWAAVQLGIFFWLFSSWMPQHSLHKGYYGLSYLDFKLTALLQANWSGILELLFAAGFLAVLLRPTWSFLLILPGLAIVVLARYSQIQSPTAIYPLAFVPFLAVIITDNMAILTGWRLRLTRLLVIAAIAAGVILQAPLLIRSVTPAFSKTAKALTIDLAVVRKSLAPNAFLLVDGNLVPALHTWRDVRVILGFIGNPAPLGPPDFKAATDVLTMFDVDQLQSCGEVRPDATDDWAARGVPFHDYDGFQRFCEWLRQVPRQKQVHADSGLVHYHLN